MPGVQTQPARKTLEYQISRLDSILDGLAENLSEAVAGAVRDGVGGVVREAVQIAVKEAVQTVLTHPEINPQRTSALQSNLPVRQTCHASQSVGEACARLRSQAREVRHACAARVRLSLAQGCDRVGRLMHVAWLWRGPLILGLAIGLLAGLSTYVLGPLLAALLTGLLAGGVTLGAVCLRSSPHNCASQELPNSATPGNAPDPDPLPLPFHP